MKQISLNDIKQEFQHLTTKEITEVCIRLARYKKENKELVAYLLFNAHDVDGYVAGIKQSMDELFNDVNTSNVYFAKKTLRKILRIANRHIKFTANKQAEAEIRIHFCVMMKALNMRIHKNKTLFNMYTQQIKKIKIALSALHADVQYDFTRQVKELEET